MTDLTTKRVDVRHFMRDLLEPALCTPWALAAVTVAVTAILVLEAVIVGR